MPILRKSLTFMSIECEILIKPYNGILHKVHFLFSYENCLLDLLFVRYRVIIRLSINVYRIMKYFKNFTSIRDKINL